MVGVPPLGGGGDFTLRALSRLCLLECFNETFMRRLIVQDLPWIIVHPALNALNLSVADLGDWLPFWDEPADEFMLVFARAPFIGSKRPGETQDADHYHEYNDGNDDFDHVQSGGVRYVNRKVIRTGSQYD